ncbi:MULTISPECIES: hypothetical protein [unclassified Pedobacter]|uniref:hypothetical protein n=1 Tax=unclassified Pedobacter TaxID=2628915 RepID=UPI001E5BB48B|nr:MULTISPECIES: hypothetical protein [unclassified Pedobacter]
MLKLNLFAGLIILSLSASAQSAKDYKFGHYYDTNGQKIDGFIYCPPSLNSIVYKSDNETEQKTLSLDKIQSVVLSGGKDSLVVKSENNKPNKLYLASVAAITPTTKFFRKFNIYTMVGSASRSMGSAPSMQTSNGRANFASTTSFSSGASTTGIDETFFYEDGNTTYELTKKNYIDILSKAFADNTALTKQFQSKYLGFDDLAMIFKKYNDDQVAK